MLSKEEYRLAPFYDLLSTRIYPALSVKFAMRIGKQHRADWVLKAHWERLAEEAGVGAKAVIGICEEMGARVPGLARGLADRFSTEHGGKEIIAKILKNITDAAQTLVGALRKG